jgi:predicted N-acyltransferase
VSSARSNALATAPLTLRTLGSIAEASASEWNALAGDCPFVRHEFLSALEQSGCASPASGWSPRHVALFDAQGLAAAAPLYRKDHSWGEFVFDMAWARAAEERGLAYYPKLLCAIPFTPASGPRLLYRSGAASDTLQSMLLAAMRAQVDSGQYSSVHGLFLDESARLACEQAGWLLRRDCHFQWHNRGYRCFDDFLATFSAEKRKKTKRERRRVSEQGIEFTTVHGHELTPDTLERIYGFHAYTFLRHGHHPYLNHACLRQLARTLGASMIVKLASRAGALIAAAIFFRSADTLYGRYWGADADYHSLHFETCYYQGIDYCIEHGLARFEPGTQGEHKLARGFEPTLTWSAHWIADAPLRRAIASYLAREALAINRYAQAAAAHVPFK